MLWGTCIGRRLAAAAILVLGTLGCDDSGDERPAGDRRAGAAGIQSDVGSGGRGESGGNDDGSSGAGESSAGSSSDQSSGGVDLSSTATHAGAGGVGGTDGPPVIMPSTIVLDFSPSALSADGSVVVGTASPGKIVRWTAAMGIESLTGEGFSAFGISADGSVVTGTTVEDAGIVRVVDGVLTEIDLPRADDEMVFLVAVSADGNTIVGTAWSTAPYFTSSTAFRWTPTGGSEDLGALPGDATSEATAISPDGRTIIGNSFSAQGVPRPFRWTEPEGMVALPAHPQSSVTIPQAVNDAGIVLGTAHIGGQARFISVEGSARLVLVRWLGDTVTEITACREPFSYPTAAAMNPDGKVLGRCGGDQPLFLAPLNGDPRFLQRPPALVGLGEIGHDMIPTGMSADASIVVSRYYPPTFGSSPNLAVWTSASDSPALATDMLPSSPVPVSNPEPLAVSTDGSTIIGQGFAPTYKGWVMRLR